MSCRYALFVLFALCTLIVNVFPSPVREVALERRQGVPYFPAEPPSCPICEASYPNINSCAEAAPVLANFSAVIFNPGAFIDVIKCACADTFQAAFPQCADCFIQTNQTAVLDVDTDNLPSLLQNVRNICALQSTLIGDVSAANAPPASTTAAPPATSTSGSTQLGWSVAALFVALAGAHLL